jgi:hypothetical protein
MRLWFWLERPVWQWELALWLAGAPIDPSVFRAVQPIYTAAPLITGMPDPIPHRIGLLEDFHDVVRVPEIAKPERPAPVGRPRREPRPDAGQGDRYARAALAGEADTVENAPKGDRHRTLFCAALKLGRFVRAGDLTRAEVLAELVAAARAAGLDDPEPELDRTIDNGLVTGGRAAA